MEENFRENGREGQENLVRHPKKLAVLAQSSETGEPNDLLICIF